MKTHKVIIADDHQLFADGLSLILKESADVPYKVVGVANDGRALMDLLKKTETDLLILDLNMPEMDGFEALASIRKQNFDFKILVVTSYADPKGLREAMKYNVNGYLVKNKGQKEFLKAAREVLRGNAYWDETVEPAAEGAVAGPSRNNHEARFEDRFLKKYSLTKRELEVLKLISQAMSNKEIGKKLYISDQTVSVHRKNIMRKLGVSNTAALVKIAYDNSLI